MRKSFVTALIAVTIACYVLQLMDERTAVVLFALWPGGGDGLDAIPWSMPWQLFTYSLLHGSPMHLLVNLFGLWMFGTQVEQVWGARRTALAWLLSVFTAAVTHLVVTAWLGQPPAPMLGASGGLFGLMLAYALMFPHARIVLLFPPIPLPARVFVLLYALFELYSGLVPGTGQVAHFAHLGGMIGGFVAWRGARRLTSSRR